MKDRIQVAGVPVDPVTFDEAIAIARGFLRGGGQHLIVTPNPEMAVLAAKDPEFARILGTSDLSLADGYGLKLAGLMTGGKIPEIITGVDFALALAALCEQENCSIYLLGGTDGVAEKAAARLRRHFPKLNVAGAGSGGRIRYRHGEWEMEGGLVRRIAKARPAVLLAALGHGKQERWIRDHMSDLPTVRIAIGIGGAFDYLSGRIRRAPAPVRAMRLEWLWRLFRQPWRAFRIMTAVIIFPLLALALLLRRK